MKFMTIDELLSRYNSGEHFDFKFFWGGFLSNWHESNFTIAGVNYWCVEQYMMAKKAELFNDTEVLEKIMRSTDQKEIKQLGREIRGYVDSEWAAIRQQVVFEGNLAKYGQNEEIGRYLVRTGNKILAEASPFDTIWGIGLGESTSNLTNPNTWKGTNFLGFVLMAVREELKAK